jgi:hypothetical protein
MPRSYEQHLKEARALEAAQRPSAPLGRGRMQGAATNPHAPWRDDPGWREWEGWKLESARHMRGD